MQEELLIPGLTAEETSLIKQEGTEIRRAKFLWPISAILSLVLFYAVAFCIWSFAIRFNFLWTTIAGAGLGLLIALTIGFHPIFVRPKTLDELRGRQLFVGLWVKFAIVFGAMGLVLIVVRMLLRV
jgi:hypothetical protein